MPNLQDCRESCDGLHGYPEGPGTVPETPSAAPMCSPEDWRAVYFAESALIDNETVSALYELAETAEDKAKLKRLGFVVNGFEDAAG